MKKLKCKVNSTFFTKGKIYPFNNKNSPVGTIDDQGEYHSMDKWWMEENFTVISNAEFILENQIDDNNQKITDILGKDGSVWKMILSAMEEYKNYES